MSLLGQAKERRKGASVGADFKVEPALIALEEKSAPLLKALTGMSIDTLKKEAETGGLILRRRGAGHGLRLYLYMPDFHRWASSLPAA